MKMYVRILLIAGYIGIVFVYGYTTVHLYLYNEIVHDAFEFQKVKGTITSIRERENEVAVIKYQYTVGKTLYQEKKDIGVKLLEAAGYSKKKGIDVLYNTSYPSISYIEQVYTEGEKKYNYLFFSPFVLVLLWATFANKDKWIRRYENALGMKKNSEA